jgi:polysaccharide export outer membrane protein
MVKTLTKLLPVLLWVAFSACKSSQELINTYNYFETHSDTLNSLTKQLKEPVIQKNDLLSIMVHSTSLNQEQAQVFNLLNSNQGGGGGGMNITTQGYLVDFEGNIRLPMIGAVKAEGLTKSALNKELVTRLSPYIKDPVINIRFLNFRVMMMGEIQSPGPQTFPNERATIVDAIGQAGGLTATGKRTNIMVFREHPDGKRTVDTLNLNDARVFGADAYQLQQNDIVYVSPYKNKLKGVNANPTIYRDIPFAISLFSTLLLLINLVFK